MRQNNRVPPAGGLDRFNYHPIGQGHGGEGLPGTGLPQHEQTTALWCPFLRYVPESLMNAAPSCRAVDASPFGRWHVLQESIFDDLLNLFGLNGPILFGHLAQHVTPVLASTGSAVRPRR